MADEVKDAEQKNAQSPQSARGDVGEVRLHSLKDQIEADHYLASREARSDGSFHAAGRAPLMPAPGGPARRRED